MPRKLHQALSAPSVKSLGSGRHADGGGLYLLVKESGARSWLFIYRSKGKAREMGLGSAQGSGAVPLSQARTLARTLLDKTKEGIDPLDERAAERAARIATDQADVVAAITFRAAATLYMDAHEKGWRNAKHRAQWASTLSTYAYPVFGDVAVRDVSTAHVMMVLEPIWTTKTETATRVRGRIEAVIDYATAREWRKGENPARWRGHVKNMLASPSKVAPVEHHEALPWQDIGDFMGKLRDRPATAARALEFAILTAGRTDEVLRATWGEINRKTGLWVVPAERMKAHREHRVPLSTAATDLLDDIAKLRSGRDPKGEAYIFPGARPRRPLSQMAMLMLLRRMDKVRGLTVHGFRSTFRDWCAETTAYPNEMAEMALAHTVGDKAEAAYRRGDMVEKRRRMMDDWAAFCSRPAALEGNVSPIRSPTVSQ